MKRLEHYPHCIRTSLTQQAEQEESSSEVECQVIFDTEHDHYQLLDVGWQSLKRIHTCFIHLDIKDGKV